MVNHTGFIMKVEQMLTLKNKNNKYMYDDVESRHFFVKIMY